MSFLTKPLRYFIFLLTISFFAIFANKVYAGILIGPSTNSNLPPYETTHQFTNRYCPSCHMDDQGGWALGLHGFGGTHTPNSYTFTADTAAAPWTIILNSPYASGNTPISGETFRFYKYIIKDGGPDWIGWKAKIVTPGWIWIERNGQYDGGGQLGLPDFTVGFGSQAHGQIISGTETIFSFNPITGYARDNSIGMLLTYVGGAGANPSADIIVKEYPLTQRNPIPPVAQAGVDQTVNEGDLINFNGSNSSDSDGTITDYQWDFGDNTTGSGPIVNHTYVENGTYTATLTVIDNDSLSSSDTLTVTVQNVAPTVNAGTDKTANEGSSINLSSSFNDSGSVDTHTATIDWGDNSLPEIGLVNEVTKTVSGSHVYTDNGIYTVRVTVVDDEGASGSDTLKAVISNVAPTAEAGGDQTTLWGNTINFNGSATDPGVNDTLTYKWDFGDNTSASGQNVAHTYNNIGTYTVTLKVTDKDSGVGEDTLTVTVNKRQPSLTTTNSSADYSDIALLSATLNSDLNIPLSNRMINFSVNAGSAGGNLTNLSGTSTIAHPLNIGQGTYPINASFSGDSYYLPSDAQATLFVDKEEATLSYTGDTLSSYGSTTQLSTSLTEESDGSYGNITKAAPVVFELANESGIVQTKTAAISELTPGAGEATATISNLPTDVYTIIVKLSNNNYYRAPIVQSLLVVYNPEGGSVTGGGWINNNGRKANFGFKAKYKKNGLLKGKFNMIIGEHDDDKNSEDDSEGKENKDSEEAPIHIKNTSFDWLVIRNETSASFAGKATVNGQGNYDFVVNIEDNGSPGKNSDTFNITMSNGFSASAVLSGGNIKIHVR